MPEENCRKTPLYERHLALGAHMAPFAGWMMPIYYTSIIDEHQCVRKRAGLFDLCHMGRLRLEGTGLLEALQRLTTNNMAELRPGMAHYTLICNEQGGVLDDAIVYRLDDEIWFVVVNASRKDVICNWFGQHRAAFMDVSDEVAMLALQGPVAAAILRRLTDASLDSEHYYGCMRGCVAGADCIITRTGYTGEDGFELYFEVKLAEKMWDDFLDAGKAQGIQPIGLGARDTLRLEAGMPLYGHELSVDINPFEAGLGKFVALDAGDFIGREALLKIKEAGPRRKLIGFEMTGAGIARHGYKILKNGTEIGQVTSGSFAPTLNRNIGMGYVAADYAGIGTELQIDIRGKLIPAQVVNKRFYQRKEHNL